MRLFLHAGPLMVGMLVAFALMDAFRAWPWLAVSELVFAAALGWSVHALKTRGEGALGRVEGVSIAASLPVFWISLLDPGIGHAGSFGLVLGPFVWHAIGGTRRGRMAAAVFLAGWGILALARVAGMQPFGPWRYPWSVWGGGLSVWFLALLLADWRERAREEERAARVAEEGTMRALLERLPVAVGIVCGERWLFCNAAMRTFCQESGRESCGTRIARHIGEDAWLTLLREGELHTEWHGEHGERPVHMVAVEGTWLGERVRMLVIVDESEERELERLRREEMLAALAGGVAHHFNNLFMGVLGAAELLRDADEKERRRLVAQIVDETERGAAICRDLVSLARRRPRHPQVLRPDAWLRRHAHTLRLLATQDVRVLVHAEADLPEIVVDRRDLEEMLLRLVHNAVEASPPESEVHVAASHVRLDDPTGWHGTGMPGDHVVFSVSNAGGMGTTTLNHALMPFHTTRDPRRPGLGLNVVLGIVRRHRGWMRIHTRKGQRTEIEVAFPVRGLV